VPAKTGGFELSHRTPRSDDCKLEVCAAEMIAKFDDAGNYRPLRTAPNLRHGWRIRASNVSEVINVVDAIYPGRLAAWRIWKTGGLTNTSLRKTLNRQSGMYRVAAKISDEQINELVGNFCRSDGGCLRTILWRRDEIGNAGSDKLAPEKFDPAVDQTGSGERCVPLLCQEACNLLVAACRELVRTGKILTARTDDSR
jgi:sirohydrochlorin cobaltochelatase